MSLANELRGQKQLLDARERLLEEARELQQMVVDQRLPRELRLGAAYKVGPLMRWAEALRQELR